MLRDKLVWLDKVENEDAGAPAGTQRSGSGGERTTAPAGAFRSATERSEALGAEMRGAVEFGEERDEGDSGAAEDAEAVSRAFQTLRGASYVRGALDFAAEASSTASRSPFCSAQELYGCKQPRVLLPKGEGFER